MTAGYRVRVGSSEAGRCSCNRPRVSGARIFRQQCTCASYIRSTQLNQNSHQMDSNQKLAFQTLIKLIKNHFQKTFLYHHFALGNFLFLCCEFQDAFFHQKFYFLTESFIQQDSQVLGQNFQEICLFQEIYQLDPRSMLFTKFGLHHPPQTI